MNQESLSFTLTQISYLIANLNKKNYAANTKQIALVSSWFYIKVRGRKPQYLRFA